VAVAEMERQAEVVKTLAAQAEVIEEDEEEEEAKPKDPEREAEEKKAAEAKAKAEAEAAEKAEAEGPPLSAAAKRRVENARWLRKVSGELSESQAQIIRLVSATPQLLPRVSVLKKEGVFEQLATLLATALRPIERDWYEATHKGSERPDGAERLEAWVRLVREHVEFLFHAAEPARLPVPSARAARVARLAAFLDVELTAKLLRSQLLQKVLLFVPEGGVLEAGEDPLRHPTVLELKQGIEAAIAKLVAHCAPEVGRRPTAAAAAGASA